MNDSYEQTKRSSNLGEKKDPKVEINFKMKSLMEVDVLAFKKETVYGDTSDAWAFKSSISKFHALTPL